MAKTVEEELQSVGRRVDIEDELTKLGLKWRYNSDGFLEDIDLKKSLANQARLGEPINEERVETYAEGIKHGAKFPAIVVDFTGRKRKGVIMDGNHRVLGADKAGYNIFARYEVTDGDPTAITLYTFEANVKHGMPNSIDDRVEHAIWLIESGVSQAQALRRLQVPRSAFHKAWYRHRADQRADAIGLDRTWWDVLAPSVRARLDAIHADEAFGEAAKLVHEAGFGMEKVQTLIAELNGTNSTTKQLAVIESYRTVYEDDIQARAGGVLTRGGSKKKLTPKQRWNMALGQITGLPEPTQVVKLIAGAERDDYKKRLNQAAEKLTALAKAL